MGSLPGGLRFNNKKKTLSSMWLLENLERKIGPRKQREGLGNW